MRLHTALLEAQYHRPGCTALGPLRSRLCPDLLAGRVSVLHRRSQQRGRAADARNLGWPERRSVSASRCAMLSMQWHAHVQDSSCSAQTREHLTCRPLQVGRADGTDLRSLLREAFPR